MPAPYGLTDSSDIVASTIMADIKNSLSTISVAGMQIGDTDVWYGDQALIPRYPAICVVPGPESSVYNGVGGRPVLITFQTFVMVYYGLVQDVQKNFQLTNQFANNLKAAVHKDPTLGGNVIDCLCNRVEPGVALKHSNALMEASRLTFQSRSKVALNP